MKSYFLFIVLVVVSLGGCSEHPDKPHNIIPEDRYIDLLVELQLVRSYDQSTQADSLTIDSLTSEVFKQYDISGEKFWESHKYYQQFPSEQQIRVEKAIERLKMDQVQNNTKDTTSAQ